MKSARTWSSPFVAPAVVHCPDQPRPRASQGERTGSVDQAVKLAGILAGDLVRDFWVQPSGLLLDVFRRFPPYTVGVRIVGTPHQGLPPHLVNQLGADRV